MGEKAELTLRIPQAWYPKLIQCIVFFNAVGFNHGNKALCFDLMVYSTILPAFL